MSKIADALRKTRATRLVTHQKSRPNGSARPTPEDNLSSTLNEAQDFLEAEPGRDLVPTDEPLEHSPEDLETRKIIYPGMPDKETENAFRDLRTLVTQKSGGGNSIILVSSVCRGGGASFVSFNLGVAYAMDWARTALVVDCHFRRPAYYNDLLSDNHMGMSDYLADPQIRVEQVVQTCGIPRLRIVPCGRRRHDVADLVNSKRAERLIKDLKRRYRERMVIMDTAPLARSPDARVLMEYCDYVLLVVPYGRANEQEIVAASKLVPASKMLGVVFNDEPRIRTPTKDTSAN